MTPMDVPHVIRTGAASMKTDRAHNKIIEWSFRLDLHILAAEGSEHQNTCGQPQLKW